MTALHFSIAAWKIVKSWLGPEAISKLKFASKAEVQTFIDVEYLPPHMGGTVRLFNTQTSYLVLNYICQSLLFAPMPVLEPIKGDSCMAAFNLIDLSH